MGLLIPIELLISTQGVINELSFDISSKTLHNPCGCFSFKQVRPTEFLERDVVFTVVGIGMSWAVDSHGQCNNNHQQ